MTYSRLQPEAAVFYIVYISHLNEIISPYFAKSEKVDEIKQIYKKKTDKN